VFLQKQFIDKHKNETLKTCSLAMKECKEKNVGINIAHGIMVSSRKSEAGRASVEAKHARKESQVKKS